MKGPQTVPSHAADPGDHNALLDTFLTEHNDWEKWRTWFHRGRATVKMDEYSKRKAFRAVNSRNRPSLYTRLRAGLRGASGCTVPSSVSSCASAAGA
ncbi:hypothetical protein QFZ74_000038 [Streptomyces sp. V3I7]|nr:hypothetical protein [Streptomyces sp. V3I7]